MDPKIKRIMADIKSVKIQGARDIAIAGLECLKVATKKSNAQTKQRYVQELKSLRQALLTLRPTEPLEKRYLDLVIERVVKFESENIVLTKKLGERVCSEYQEKLNVEIMQISRNGAGQIEDGDVILMHCHSESVAMALKEARKQKKSFSVIVTETSPLMQGVTAANEVKKIGGISVTYCEDAAAGLMMRRATKCLMGCDAILPDGSIINKIGTFPMAIVAKQFGKPFIVIGESGKYTETIPELEQRDPAEVIPQKRVPGVKVENPAFDITPAEFITLIVTERGLTKPENAKMELSV